MQQRNSQHDAQIDDGDCDRQHLMMGYLFSRESIHCLTPDVETHSAIAARGDYTARSRGRQERPSEKTDERAAPQIPVREGT